ncbi:calcium/sodium antiporter [Coraliomargarita parva]|uniref:calcium/sodium antiporter n=1 Tax=Coraliomargarita parva TaxID=3014050 RepID=UPI0022B3240B|nr:calcium/sodium antiporter [Coraliomargarita parva]
MTLGIFILDFSSFPIWALVFALLLGLAGLTFGGDWLTKGAAAISVNLKINPVVVGLTVVSIATSMPEMFTSLLAARGSPGLALGNIMGSNIANIGLILGLTALILPLRVQLRLIHREMPILLLVSALFTVFATGGYARWEGLVLLGIAAAYLFFVVRWARQESADIQEEFFEAEDEIQRLSVPVAVVLVLLGALLLALGAKLLVGSSVEIASRLGASETLVGLTIVAIGTSLPELAASIAAVRAGHTDICAGNIVGSNLFNILLIGGATATFFPFPVNPAMLLVEFPSMLLLTVLLLLVFKTGHIVTRREGAFLLFLYLMVLSLSALSQEGLLF